MSDNFDQFPERLRLALKGESVNSFAKKCGVTESLLRKYLGGSLPGMKHLVTISEQAGVDLVWLTTGEGPMEKIQSLTSSAEQITFAIRNLEGRQVEFRPSKDLCHMPIMDLKASCGPGNFLNGESVQAVFSATASWIRRELGANPEDLSLVFADGDSMADTIKPEEIVIVDRSKTRRPGDGIWVFLYEEGLFIKRLQFMPGKQIKVKSDNPHYEPYTLTPDDSFRLLGRVIAALPLRRL